jgi:DNA-binding Xre family transcriptional regulator
MDKDRIRICVPKSPNCGISEGFAIGNLASTRKENKARGREVLDERRRLGDAVAVLKSIREQQGITLTTMAERLGMPKGNLSRLENMDGPNSKIGTLEKYARAPGRTIEIAVVET